MLQGEGGRWTVSLLKSSAVSNLFFSSLKRKAEPWNFFFTAFIVSGTLFSFAVFMTN